MQPEQPPVEPPDGPTTGDPTGAHRVLEPESSLAAVATRLDAHPDLWDRELRVELTDIVLGADDHRGLQRPAGGDPARMRAALLEASAERGGLPPELVGTVLVGRVGARGAAAPPGPVVGDRVALLPPVSALPVWLRDVSGWSGGRRVPLAGHAVVHARTRLVVVPEDVEPELVHAVGLVAHVPAAVRDALAGPGTRVLVVGPTTVAGATAVVTANGTGARVAGIVGGLADARLVRALAPAEPVIAASSDTRPAAAAVEQTLAGPADVVVVAEPDRELVRVAAGAVRDDGRIVVVVPGVDVDGVVLDAAGRGATPTVTLPARCTDAGDELFRLLAEDGHYAALVSWRAGLAPAPAGAAITPDADEGPART